MTEQDLREIYNTTNPEHAEFCLEQHTTQVGIDAAQPLWTLLWRMMDEDAANEPSEA